MRTTPAARIPSPLKAPQEIERLASFCGLTCRPNPSGPQIVALGATKVFIQPMDFVELESGFHRPAPPLLIGPVRVTPYATSLLAKLAPRLRAVTAFDACVDDDDGPDARLKAFIAAVVFEVDVTGKVDTDFSIWRQCRGDLAVWHMLLFARPQPIVEWPRLGVPEVLIDLDRARA